MTVQALQDELRIQRDLNQLLQQDPASQGRDLALTSEPTEENYRRLHAEHERQAKELFLLRKTLEEMELRIDTQKQTLGARDESIKKLLEMLQSKGRCEPWKAILRILDMCFILWNADVYNILYNILINWIIDSLGRRLGPIMFWKVKVFIKFFFCFRTICQGFRGRPGAHQKTSWCRDAQASPWEFTGPEGQRDFIPERGNMVSATEFLVCISCFYTFVVLSEQELHRRYEGTPESTKTKALQTVIDMKVRRVFFLSIIITYIYKPRSRK